MEARRSTAAKRPARSGLDLSHHAWFSGRTFQCIAVPFGGDSRGLVGALEKFEQRSVRVRRRTDGVIRQEEFAQGLAEKCGLGSYPRGSETGWFGIGVGVERRVIDCAGARPKAGAALLVGIGLARNRVRQVRHAAGMAGRATAGEAANREIEAAPEKMHR